ncbi:MAG TPA: diguanylate cyclase, partial [Steroidobacteraceae bacterium]|nr:diguanylate cyclase [Steroidobacteraceae bacterium]
WGGEEFVLLIPNANAQQANEAVDRIRASLATALLTGGTAAFTSSFGIADTTMSPRFERMVRIADEALYRAKEEGRDRAIIGDSRLATTGEFRRAVEHPASITVRKLAEG